ncbi:Regulator SirB [Gammaproteobacteria bacterium]
MYADIRHLHQVLVVVTAGLFWLRVYWAMTGSPKGKARWTRILPHANDALLLTSGVTMVVLSGQYPLKVPWLTIKLLAVGLYILLGVWLLRFARSSRERGLVALVTGLVFVYIVTVALTRQPWPVF